MPDEASGSRRFLGPADDYFFGDADLGRNLARKRIGPTMLAGGAIRVGGTVLLLYGAYGSARRIADAAPTSSTAGAAPSSAISGAWMPRCRAPSG